MIVRSVCLFLRKKNGLYLSTLPSLTTTLEPFPWWIDSQNWPCLRRLVAFTKWRIRSLLSCTARECTPAPLYWVLNIYQIVCRVCSFICNLSIFGSLIKMKRNKFERWFFMMTKKTKIKQYKMVMFAIFGLAKTIWCPRFCVSVIFRVDKIVEYLR